MELNRSSELYDRVHYEIFWRNVLCERTGGTVARHGTKWN